MWRDIEADPLRRGTSRPAARLRAAARVLACAVSASGCGFPSLAAAADTGPTAAGSLRSLLTPAIRASGTLTIATDAHHPPCESFADDNTTVVGVEPDFWNALARDLGVKPVVASVDFAAIIPGVKAGRFDVAFACISDQPEREREVTFIDYAYGAISGYVMAGRAGAAGSSADLCGRRGGVQIGTDFAIGLRTLSKRCTDGGKPPVTVQQYPSEAAVVLALYSGRVDFILDDRQAVKHIQAYSPTPIKPIDVGFPPATIGAIVAKGDTALAAALKAAFEAMHRDGTYAAIMSKWSITPLSLDRPEIDRIGAR